MIKKIFFVSLLVLGSLAYAELKVGPNDDCYVRIAPIQDRHVAYDPFDGGESFYGPLTKTSDNHFEFIEPKHNAKFKVDLDLSKSAALIQVDAPDMSDARAYRLSTKNPTGSSLEDPNVTYVSGVFESKYQYWVSCSFGLHDVVETIEARWEREVEALGPPLEWPDQSAPNLETLKKGSIIEVTRAFTVQAGRPYIVEQAGLVDSDAFSDIPHLDRFANVWLMNGNNGWYLRAATYPKGLKMKVVDVIPSHVEAINPWTQYEIHLQTIEKEEWPFRMVDPILRMKVMGRRGGRAEVKLPQFVEMMKPYMKVTPL